MSLAVDLDPCHRYDWPADAPCAGVYSGAHVCGLGAGHDGVCVCAQCELEGDRPVLRMIDWRQVPTAEQVAAHAAQHGVAMMPIVPRAVDNWLTAPKVAAARWLVRTADHTADTRHLRESRGWVEPAHGLHVLLVTAHQGVIHWHGPSVCIAVTGCRWLAGSEWRPVDAGGAPVPWP